ncbi:MAG: hypothetical protein JKY27_11860 [Magnetovibrio sp.]|nr:hypothetical protein [Magnetovibrio sp.]
MTGIVTNIYTSQYTDIITSSSQQSNSGSSSSSTSSVDAFDSATTVVLSQEAQDALNDRSFEVVADDAHAKMNKILSDSNRASPLENGMLVADLSVLDDREIFAISSNAGYDFSTDEVKSAGLEQQRRFDAALAGPTAVARVTGEVTQLYTAAMQYLDTMSEEQQASGEWQSQKTAVQKALAQLEVDSNTVPTDIPDDPVANYLERIANGDAANERAFGDVTNDARAALDQQYAEAEADGQKLSDAIDFSDFSGRSLAAVALNNNDQFSDAEVGSAKSEIRQRSANAIRAAFGQSQGSGGASAFAQNIISQYGSMSNEEREAAGWTEEFYNKIVSHYETSSMLSEMMSNSSSSSGYLSLLNYL